MKGPMPLELPKYEPTPIPKALKQKPKESKITFQGVGQTGIRFLIPQRKLGFEDYLSFVAVTLFIFFMCWIRGGRGRRYPLHALLKKLSTTPSM